MRGLYQGAGFTIVEMLVTVVLAGIFLTFFLQMYRATSAQQASLTRQAAVNDIAKSNLNKYPTSNVFDSLYTCDTDPSATTNTNNLTINKNAAGNIILDSTSVDPNINHGEPDPGNLGTLVQRVKVYWPLGCSGGHVPIKIESTVEYGFTGQRDKVVYATYIF